MRRVGKVKRLIQHEAKLSAISSSRYWLRVLYSSNIINDTVSGMKFFAGGLWTAIGSKHFNVTCIYRRKRFRLVFQLVHTICDLMENMVLGHNNTYLNNFIVKCTCVYFMMGNLWGRKFQSYLLSKYFAN